MPLRIAFSASVGFEAMNEWAWYIFDLAVDVCFLTDIGLTFRTAYEVVAVEGGKNNDITLVTDGRRIARRYAKVWFPIDLVSSVPFDTIVAAVLAGGLGPSTEVGGGGGGALSFTRLLKLIRLVRLLKLFRVLKLGKLFKRIEEGAEINPAFIRFVKLLFEVCARAFRYSRYCPAAAGVKRTDRSQPIGPTS